MFLAVLLMVQTAWAVDLCQFEPVMTHQPIKFQYNRTHSANEYVTIELNQVEYFIHNPTQAMPGAFINQCQIRCSLWNEAFTEEVFMEGLSIDGSTVTIHSDFNVQG